MSPRWHSTIRTSTILAMAVCCSVARASIVIPDAAGDTFGAGAVQQDILSVTSTVSATNVVFTVLFGGPVASPSAFAANSVVGYLDLDVDQDDATGVSISHGAPTTFAGSEFYVDLFSEIVNPGQAEVVSVPANNTVGTAIVSFAAQSFSVTIPLTLLGADDGVLDYGVVLGTFSEATDIAIGSTRLEVTGVVPEPGSMMVWGLMLIAGRLAVFCKGNSTTQLVS